MVELRSAPTRSRESGCRQLQARCRGLWQEPLFGSRRPYAARSRAPVDRVTHGARSSPATTAEFMPAIGSISCVFECFRRPVWRCGEGLSPGPDRPTRGRSQLPAREGSSLEGKVFYLHVSKLLVARAVGRVRFSTGPHLEFERVGVVVPLETALNPLLTGILPHWLRNCLWCTSCPAHRALATQRGERSVGKTGVPAGIRSLGQQPLGTCFDR